MNEILFEGYVASDFVWDRVSRNGTPFVFWDLVSRRGRARWRTFLRCHAYKRTRELVLELDLRKDDLIRVQGYLRTYPAVHGCRKRHIVTVARVRKVVVIERSKRIQSLEDKLDAMVKKLL